MNMEKVINLLLKQEEIKDIPINVVFKVVNSLFHIINTENVFYKE